MEKLSHADIDNMIGVFEFVFDSKLTMVICVMTLTNGYIVTGDCAIAPFGEAVAKDHAFAFARNKIWSLVRFASMGM